MLAGFPEEKKKLLFLTSPADFDCLPGTCDEEDRTGFFYTSAALGSLLGVDGREQTWKLLVVILKLGNIRLAKVILEISGFSPDSILDSFLLLRSTCSYLSKHSQSEIF